MASIYELLTQKKRQEELNQQREALANLLSPKVQRSPGIDISIDPQIKALTSLLGPQAIQNIATGMLTPNEPKLTSGGQGLVEAGIMPGSPEFLKRRLEILMKPPISMTSQAGKVLNETEAINMGLDPSQTWWLDPEKGPKKLTSPSDTQRNAAGFAARMEHNGRILESIENISGFDPTSLAVHSNKILPEVIANFYRTSEGQQYYTAQRNWVRANLRKESGAVIGPEEMADEIATYFPQPGDSIKTIEQKRISRQISEKNMKAQGGEFYEKTFGSMFAPKKGIPDGSFKIGITPDGKPVFQAPDGSRHVED